jgi:hypothetical protein
LRSFERLTPSPLVDYIDGIPSNVALSPTWRA